MWKQKLCLRQKGNPVAGSYIPHNQSKRRGRLVPPSLTPLLFPALVSEAGVLLHIVDKQIICVVVSLSTLVVSYDERELLQQK